MTIYTNRRYRWMLEMPRVMCCGEYTCLLSISQEEMIECMRTGRSIVTAELTKTWRMLFKMPEPVTSAARKMRLEYWGLLHRQRHHRLLGAV